MRETDLTIIGGGIVGLATAYAFTQRNAGKRVTVLEKEPQVALHQTGRNSGVIHSGIYYKPGSAKAQNCFEGKRLLEQFCRDEGIPFDSCGKVIVAVDETQILALDEINRRGRENGVACERIGREQLAELEPHAAGVAALHVPSTGIVDYTAVSHRLVKKIFDAGGEVVCGARVTSIAPSDDGVVIVTPTETYRSARAVNCAGLHSDRVARMSGGRPAARIVPFRGEYFSLRPEATHLVRNLIYPVPDPQFPFLGVHFTRMIDGGVECGPNAVPALAREGYAKTSFNPLDAASAMSYAGFLRLAAKHWRMGAGELWRSANKRAFVRALQRLVPDIRAEHLEPAPSGIRAQAVRPTGELVDDFLIEEAGPVVNVLNAPSSAATASLRIGELVVERLMDE